MKILIIFTLCAFSLSSVFAEDVCTQSGWQNAKATRVESGDEYTLALDIIHNGKAQSIWANCGETCYGFETTIMGESYTAPLNASVQVKLGRTVACDDVNDTECMETGSAVCFIKALKTKASAQKAGFDCNKSSNWTERTICKSDELMRLDYQMTSQYKRDLASASSNASMVKDVKNQ